MSSEISDERRFFVLLITQVAGSFLAILVASLLDGVYREKAIDMSILSILAFISILALIFSKPTIELMQIPLPTISVALSVWVNYFIDLSALGYLIYFTGGFVNSPFTPLLVLLPTNGVILAQEPLTVSKYYLGVALLSFFLIYISPENPVMESAKDRYLHTVTIIFFGTLLTAVIGYWARDSVNKE